MRVILYNPLFVPIKESMKEIYYKYSDYLREKFGEKVYKLPISLPLTCPNRDGTCSTGGCIYCSEEGGSHENLENTMSIRDQLKTNWEKIGKKYGAKKYIAYFQSFSNTYMDFESFKRNIEEVIKLNNEYKNIVGISISTRPDLVPNEFLEYLSSLKEDYLITMEYGLQSVNNKTIKILNRGHSLSDFIDATIRTKAYGLRVCTHMILNLPWDDLEDTIEGANILSALSVDEVKLHSLYITKGTKLGQMFEENQVDLHSKEDYIIRVGEFLSHLDRTIAVQRLLGRAPEEKTLFSNWDTSWWKIQDQILEYMEKNNMYQGCKSKFKK